MRSNRGMFLEELLNNTCKYYEKHNIAIIEKREIPILITSNNAGKITGILKSKSRVDYFGNWNGRHMEFEAKTTASDVYYPKASSAHQVNFLTKSQANNAITFLVIYFSKYKKFFLVRNFESKISYTMCVENEKEIPLRFPGIIDFISLLVD